MRTSQIISSFFNGAATFVGYKALLTAATLAGHTMTMGAEAVAIAAAFCLTLTARKMISNGKYKVIPKLRDTNKIATHLGVGTLGFIAPPIIMNLV